MFGKSSLAFVAVLSLPSVSLGEAVADPHHAVLLSKVGSSMHKKAGNLRRELSETTATQGSNGAETCRMINVHFAEDFIPGSTDGSCDCHGDLTDTMSLSCTYDNVCDDFDLFCATIQTNITLSGILNPGGGFGSDPEMGIDACIDSNVDFLEEMCLRLDFGKPNFFLPRDCEFSYGDEKCVCDVDQNNFCYTFNCNGVVPENLEGYIVADTCKQVDLAIGGDPHMFLPALADLPDETVGSHQDENTDLTAIEEGFLSQTVMDDIRDSAPKPPVSSGFRALSKRSGVVLTVGLGILGIFR